MNTPLSLILVTVDCLRADHVGFLGYTRPTTPFLDSLAAESFVVPNAIVGGVPTYYSFPSILASRHPLAMGRDLAGLSPDETTLTSCLKRSGYATGAFLAANPYLSGRFGYDQAFDVFHDFLNQEPAATAVANGTQSNDRLRRLNRLLEKFSRRLGPIGPLYDDLYFEYCQFVSPAVQSVDSLRPFPAAHIIRDQVSEWLSSVCHRPFFLWMHLMDPHAPYYPPGEAMDSIGARAVTASRMRYLNSYWNRRDIGPSRLRKYRDAVLELYDSSIRWVDTQMSRLVKLLETLNIWDRCVLALTADHGEEFLEHDAPFHAPWTMREELIRVPLLVRHPAATGQVTRRPFSHVDLAPTLVDAVNLPVPSEFQGRSRWHKWQQREDWEEPVVVESAECLNPSRPETRLAARVLCVREERYKLILRFATGKEELFDLRNDRAERNALPANAELPVRRRLLETARGHMERTRRTDRSAQRLRARLRDLRFQLAESTPVNCADHREFDAAAHSLRG